MIVIVVHMFMDKFFEINFDNLSIDKNCLFQLLKNSKIQKIYILVTKIIVLSLITSICSGAYHKHIDSSKH
jgi:hypothetical protein